MKDRVELPEIGSRQWEEKVLTDMAYAIRRDDGLWFAGCGYGGAGNPVPYFDKDLSRAKLYMSRSGIRMAEKKNAWMKRYTLSVWQVEISSIDGKPIRPLGPLQAGQETGGA
jgi:hypothetical protein